MGEAKQWRDSRQKQTIDSCGERQPLGCAPAALPPRKRCCWRVWCSSPEAAPWSPLHCMPARLASTPCRGRTSCPRSLLASAWRRARRSTTRSRLAGRRLPSRPGRIGTRPFVQHSSRRRVVCVFGGVDRQGGWCACSQSQAPRHARRHAGRQAASGCAEAKVAAPHLLIEAV